jgi:galactose mutarotase-like enzyme
MAAVNRISDPVESLELVDMEAESRVVLAPSRGGIATRFKVTGREVFYLDEETLRDPSKNVRGGNPVLFPSPGKLTGDAYEQSGHSGQMKQHGFARTLPFEVVETWGGESASATLRLTSSEATRAAFPWDFVFELTYSLKGKKLKIEQRVTNGGTERMPFGLGFHPYFRVPQEEKPGARVETRATRAFDNVQGKTVTLDRVALALPEVDLHLVDNGAKQSALAWGDDRVTIEASPEFTHWVVWTLSGKDFVCLEPWTCAGDALNSGERLTWVEPGETRSLWVLLTADMKPEKKPRPPREPNY